ncbi:hypothetical protein ACFJIV_27110 [Mucilaginibacter sp. UC70_90]
MLPVVLKWAWGKPNLREAFFKRVSQTGISYRDSTINLNLSPASQIKAGDRLPYLKVFDEKREVETDLHEWCSKPGFTLICLGKLKELDLFYYRQMDHPKLRRQSQLFLPAAIRKKSTYFRRLRHQSKPKEGAYHPPGYAYRFFK